MKVIRSMVLVSVDQASLEHGAEEVFHKFLEEIDEVGLSDRIAVSTIRDVGLRDDLPVVIVYPDAAVYGPVKVEDVHTIVEEHLHQGNIVPHLLALRHQLPPEIAWTRGRKGALPIQKRVVLERAGIVDPESIEDYIQYDGFQALGKALTQMTPAEVIAEIDKSGLQGRGGAGFPTGRKWSFVASTPGHPKYVICNADESEPGTFKDRLIMEGDPFSIVEAVTIAGYSIGAHEGYIYIRGEYPLAYRRIE
ncbi:MAG TPA: NADP oxidoreductase, partial [Anaerolineae bacterium]|nr:NADP oxidoreductase [Anaerolineae bacterium]